MSWEALGAMLATMQVVSRLSESPESVVQVEEPLLPRLQGAECAGKTPPSSAQVLENFKRATAQFFRRRLPEPRPVPGSGSDAGPWVSSCTMQAWEQALGKKPLGGSRRTPRRD